MSIVALPVNWDLDVFFPGTDSAEYRAACMTLTILIERFAETLERAERKGDVAALESVIRSQNEVAAQIEVMSSYVQCRVAANSKDDVAQAAASEFEMLVLPYRKLGVRATAWIGSLDVPQMVASSEFLAAHAYALSKIHISSQHLMSPGEESLASDLAQSSTSGWEKLQSNVSSQIEVNVPLPSGTQTLSMSMTRNLAYDPDRAVRKAGYEAELAAWRANEVPIAAAMNGLKGAVNTLSSRRGWDSALDQALFGANIDRETLDAMLAAARESFPDFRRYMNAKARALGISKMGFFDIFAPLKGQSRAWSYEDGAQFVADQFRGYSEKMGAFAERTYREAWIDVFPKAGKVDGAFCSGFRKDESRVLMNFKPSFGSVSTLAHELGHAYHGLCLAERTPLQQRTPMTLAETASIFCETIIRQAGLATGTPEERLTILEASLQGSCQVVVDITSRFLFEQSVFEKRKARDLSAAELCEAMRDAQLQTYGDGLDPKFLHPYMWAAKPHYYSTYSFYNFPYMFGLLFALGLYAVYQREPAGFQARYDDLLSSTGMADAATLSARFGIDIRSIDFWRGSLDQIRGDIDAFEKLV